jgi:hypothetical protein
MSDDPPRWPSPETLALLQVELAHWFRETENPMFAWWALASCPRGAMPPWVEDYLRDAALKMITDSDAVLEALGISRERSKAAHKRLQDVVIAQLAALHADRGERDPVRAVVAAGGREVGERQAQRIVAMGRRLNEARPAPDEALHEIRRLDSAGRCVIEFTGAIDAPNGMFAPFRRESMRQRIRTVPPDFGRDAD